MSQCKFCNQEHSIEELCKISRRSFFFFSTAALVTLATAKLSLPTQRILTDAEIVAVELEKFIPKLSTLFDKDDIFWAHMHPAQKRFYEDMLPNGPGRKFIT